MLQNTPASMFAGVLDTPRYFEFLTIQNTQVYGSVFVKYFPKYGLKSCTIYTSKIPYSHMTSGGTLWVKSGVLVYLLVY